MSLIVTADVQARSITGTTRESQKQKITDYCTYHLGQGKFMADSLTNPTIAEKQLGTPMLCYDLENLLLRISPDFKFFPAHDYVINNSPLVPNGTRFPMKSLWWCNGQRAVPLTNYHADSMPEWSLFDWTEKEVPDPTFEHANRKDYPKMEWTGWKDGFVKVDPTAPMPGYLKVKEPWHEIRRGWRKVLVVVVQELPDIASPERVERLVGSGDRKSWAAGVGRRRADSVF